MKLLYLLFASLLLAFNVRSQELAVADAPMSAHEVFERVLRAQVLLERQWISPGEIDGAPGSNMRQALLTFQARELLPETGELDEATWELLNRDNSPTLVDYEVTPEDTAGPFRAVPRGMHAKARLRALGYANAAEGLGEKFRASPALLARLNPASNLSRSGHVILVPNVGDKPPLPPAARIVVYAARRVLQLEDEYGQLLAQFPVSMGGPRDPLPIGLWQINGIFPNPVYQYNPKLFWDAPRGDRPARIQPGPNNPVGVVWMALSKPHYGIHGTPSPGLIGKTESHGCIRMTNWSALEVAQLVQPGTPVDLRD